LRLCTRGGGAGSRLLLYLKRRASRPFFPPDPDSYGLRIGLITLANPGGRVGTWAVPAGSGEEWNSSLCSLSQRTNTLLYGKEWS